MLTIRKDRALELTLDFDSFWSWLLAHPNCILRAGSADSVLYDDQDLHWHFASEGPEQLSVQVIRGKRLMGELMVEPERVTYVQGSTGDQEGEYIFELVSETDRDHLVAYFFVLSHGYDHEPSTTPGPVH